MCSVNSAGRAEPTGVHNGNGSGSGSADRTVIYCGFALSSFAAQLDPVGVAISSATNGAPASPLPRALRRRCPIGAGALRSGAVAGAISGAASRAEL